MSDAQVMLLAGVVWCAALIPVGASQSGAAVIAVVVAFAWRRRRPWLLIVVAGVLASLLAGIAWASIDHGVRSDYRGVAWLVTDPRPAIGGVEVTVEVDGDRYHVRAWGSAAGGLRNRLMGEVVEIEAALRPLDDAPSWLRAQGLSGRGTVRSVRAFDVGAPHHRLANSIRRTIESGAASLDRDERALFAGLVYGDDRAQSPLTADDFQAAGLTHLLAVSGQNVAFVLAIAGPLLRRLAHRQRFAFVLLVLLVFATVTRFEPSVMRASVMAAVAAVAALVGTEVSSRRIMALAVTALILVDPLIVHRIAFQLSVAASAGILLWSGRVARAIPGPRVVVESLAVTATAQLAVAPLLVWRFDGLPVASLPANLLAGPAAGPVMMWGLTGGLVAGLVPDPVASLLHVPTRALLWWIDGVAALAPQVPLGGLAAVHIAILFAAGAWGLRQHRRRGRLAALVVVLAVLAQPAVSLGLTEPVSSAIDGRSAIWRDRTVTILELDASSDPEDVLAALRRTDAGTIDLVIARQDSRLNAAMVEWIRTRHEIRAVWSPGRSLGVGEVVPDRDFLLRLERLTLTVARDGDLLVVDPGGG